MEGLVLHTNEWHEITVGYRERTRRMALFAPLYELERRQEKDVAGLPIDMKGLGLLTLLFFFEHKLQRSHKAGTHELAQFLKKITEQTYQLDWDRYMDLAGKLIEVYRPVSGKKRAYEFFNWETRQQELIEYSLLKSDDFDAKTQRQFYTLDEDGLELVFATKEFFNEFQLSISQLMIRKQLEKGEYRSALRQMNEMRISVESLRERMVKLRNEVQRSIVSEDTYERYKQLLEDIGDRLSRENEEFMELKEFVHDTKNRLFEEDYHIQEPEAYSYVIEITSELEIVHNDHSRLLEQSMSLINHTLRAAQDSLYYTGVEAFNFNQDIVSTIIVKPLPLEAMKGVLHPFFKLPYKKQWSPLTVFEQQSLREERDEPIEDTFILAQETDHDQQMRLALQQHFTEMMRVVLEAYQNGHQTLIEIISIIKTSEYHSWLDDHTFYHFWLLLHQRSPVKKEQHKEESDQHILDQALQLLDDRTMTVTEIQETIQVTDRFRIQNMHISITQL